MQRTYCDICGKEIVKRNYQDDHFEVNVSSLATSGMHTVFSGEACSVQCRDKVHNAVALAVEQTLHEFRPLLRVEAGAS